MSNLLTLNETFGNKLTAYLLCVTLSDWEVYPPYKTYNKEQQMAKKKKKAAKKKAAPRRKKAAPKRKKAAPRRKKAAKKRKR